MSRDFYPTKFFFFEKKILFSNEDGNGMNRHLAPRVG